MYDLCTYEFTKELFLSEVSIFRLSLDKTYLIDVFFNGILYLLRRNLTEFHVIKPLFQFGHD